MVFQMRIKKTYNFSIARGEWVFLMWSGQTNPSFPIRKQKIFEARTFDCIEVIVWIKVRRIILKRTKPNQKQLIHQKNSFQKYWTNEKIDRRTIDWTQIFMFMCYVSIFCMHFYCKTKKKSHKKKFDRNDKKMWEKIDANNTRSAMNNFHWNDRYPILVLFRLINAMQMW